MMLEKAGQKIKIGIERGPTLTAHPQTTPYFTYEASSLSPF